MVEDLLIMPDHLQADVIVPLVNFMYTGTFEFQLNMYEKLLRTAREMNMTVLSKLLEAHRQPSNQVMKQPIVLNKHAPKQSAYGRGGSGTTTVVRSTSSQQKPHVVYKHHQTTIKPISVNKNIPEPIQIITKYNQDSKSRPSRFTVPEEILPDSEKSFDNISYESKPLLTASQAKKEEENSPFESLRKGYTNKRVAAVAGPGYTAPPNKRMNLADVKELGEAQQQRSTLDESEEDDDDNYDGDTNFIEDDYDEEVNASGGKSNDKSKSGTITKQITVKDEGGNVNHAKIISEVLKKYPHLVKNHKNIKLKIMQRPSQNNKQTTAIVQAIKQEKSAGATTSKVITTNSAGVFTKSSGAASGTSSQQSSAPKRIDAKTMHALIAKGAENMTGPWLCLKCGVNNRPISIPSYKSFRKHLITVHNEKIDPRICEHCGFKVSTRLEMYSHLHQEHQIKPPPDVKLKSSEITIEATTSSSIPEQTISTKKPEQQCIYCNKTFTKEFLLYAHMRSVHRHKAKSDGVLDFTDEEDEEYVPNVVDSSNDSSKIKILSNVSLAPNSILDLGDSTLMAQQPSSEAEALTNVAAGIATSLRLITDSGVDSYDNNFIEDQLAEVHGEYIKKEDLSAGSDVITKLITADGTELQLTQSQKDEILQQLQTQGADISDNVVMVLDQGQFDQVVNANTSDNNMVVVYPETTDVSQTTTLSNVDLENAEIVFQSSDQASADENEKSSQEDTDKETNLISQLEGDWNTDEKSNEKSAETNSNEPEIETEPKEELEATSAVAEDIKGEETTEKLRNLLDDWSEDEPEDSQGPVTTATESNVTTEPEPQETPTESENATKEPTVEDSAKNETEDCSVDSITQTRTVEEEMQYVFGESGEEASFLEEDGEKSQESKMEVDASLTLEQDKITDDTKPDEFTTEKAQVEEEEIKCVIEQQEDTSSSKDGKGEEISSLLNEWDEKF